MLLVKTYLSNSDIHGLGVFAGEFIPKGARIWRFVKGFDHSFSPSEYAKLPKPARDYIQHHGYMVDGKVMFTVDNDHHMNHADPANTRWFSGHIVASRDIRKGEEITNDYGLFDTELCAAFLRDKKNGKVNGNSKLQVKANGNGRVHAKANGNGKPVNGKSVNGDSKPQLKLNGHANGRLNGKANGKLAGNGKNGHKAHHVA